MQAEMVWLSVTVILLVLMQAGFACLESGLVRAKNSINVAMKNLADVCLVLPAFLLVGVGFAFGQGSRVVGAHDPALIEHLSGPVLIYALVQGLLCAAAATIVSGAVAERIRFGAYLGVSLSVALLFYPLVARWVWGGHVFDTAPGWLRQMGFTDFAGATVVHGVGGWVALAAVVVIGPRRGRFGPGGRRPDSHDPLVAALGAFLLWVGWFGFVGSNVMMADVDLGRLVVSVMLAGTGGAGVAMVVSRVTLGRIGLEHTIGGLLAGLVSITAAAPWAAGLAALGIGAMGAVVQIAGVRWMAARRWDDAVHAVPTHLFAGIWGTLAVAAVAPAPEAGRGALLLIQGLGVVVVGGFVFPVAWLGLTLVSRVVALRASPEAERVGLNIAEHGAGSAMLDLVDQMDRQARTGNFERPVTVEPATDAARIAWFYNAVRKRFLSENRRKQQALERLERLARLDPLTRLGNRRAFSSALRRALSRAARQDCAGAVLFVDLDDFKAVNDQFGHTIGDRVLCDVAGRMQHALRQNDVVARLGGDEFAVLLEDLGSDRHDAAPVAARVAQKLVDLLAQPLKADGGIVRIGASVGMALFDRGGPVRVEDVLRRADRAMYRAKRTGKGRYCQDMSAHPPAMGGDS